MPDSARALDDEQNLTSLGRILARLPLDPHAAQRIQKLAASSRDRDGVCSCSLQVGLALLMGHWLFGLGDAMVTLCARLSLQAPHPVFRVAQWAKSPMQLMQGAAMSFDEPFHFERSAGYLPWSISQRYQGGQAAGTVN